MFKEYQHLDLPAFELEILSNWEKEKIFEKSVSIRPESNPFIFYEGPPSANGMPGIHHVMARTVKDIFCRFKTMKGFRVERKGGWDTHGLPVELQVEKELGIRKDDIGKSISIEDYNAKCRETVMRYKSAWDDLTKRIGFWVDLKNPYITYENDYIESLWSLLQKLYNKGLLYKGYTIQPYSPAAGTGLSSHELNQPGTYKMVKDQTLVAMFKLAEESQANFHEIPQNIEAYFLAWTTTPWTLPSNTGLAVGKKIQYLIVKTLNPFAGNPILVILAKDRFSAFFQEHGSELAFDNFQIGQKILPWQILAEKSGDELYNLRYTPLFNYARPLEGDPYRVVTADFVTTEDGTGIVHIAPSFGADDFKTGKLHGLGQLTLVDKTGRFTDEVNDAQFPLKGRFVKEAYLNEEEKAIELSHQQLVLKNIIPQLQKYLSVDDLLGLKLKLEGKVFKMEKYEHTYPHCWRTDKPILYYPLDSWFICTTKLKERMVELNKTIHWMPPSTGTGRFGNWLENLQDWNLSRSRFWGTPLPIWRSEDRIHEICIGSIDELKQKVLEAQKHGYSLKVNLDKIDLHRPFVDDIVLVSSDGKPMFREADLIDVWFDSGAMPYAQHHWPFENHELFLRSFPADFIAEGVDQTRGWFFTLHALSVMLFDKVAYKSVISNGLVLDKFGNKMSKRLGNVVNPSDMINLYGVDALRWYFMSNSDPWDNLKFDPEGVAEVQRKLFSTLYNVYGFFALYANIDQFKNQEEEVPLEERSELDQWILSLLHSLISEVDLAFQEMMPTRAARAIQEFVTENLSNWYVRLSRRKFWKGDYSVEKVAAYQTLYTCLEIVSRLMAPISPFYADRLFLDLQKGMNQTPLPSVHLADFPESDLRWIQKNLERKMEVAQRASSLVLSIRKKSSIKVRQPLNKVIIPVISKEQFADVQSVAAIIANEVNVKFVEVVNDAGDMVKKKIKPNFRVLGARAGQNMKELSEAISKWSAADIREIESQGSKLVQLAGIPFEVSLSDVEILSEDIPGWQVASDRNLTVALDVQLTPELQMEGLARELINRIQNQRKELGFEVTDRITITLEESPQLRNVVDTHLTYICDETLADKIWFDSLNENSEEIELEGIKTKIYLQQSIN